MSAISNPLPIRLLSSLLMLAGLFNFASSGHAQTFEQQLAAWVERLEQESIALEQQIGQPMTRVGAGGPLRPGVTGERVLRLSQRLVELGYLPDGQQTDIFDGMIENAIRLFQADRQLKPDGVVGSQTLAGLDRTPTEAVAALKRTVQAMRQFKTPDNVVLVNLPSQTAIVVRKGVAELTMRVAVGRPERETPLLEDTITHIIVNPTWTVPLSIVTKDKLPNLRKTGSTGIEAANIYLDGESVLPETVDWTMVDPRRIRIVQSPGDHNALGRFRFNLTNDQSIYLHGTNEPHVFARDLRAVSSGCVRLENARQLAELLLADNRVSTERIDALLATGAPQWIKLSRPMPVRFVYWTATVGADNSVRYHPDIYRISGTVTTGPSI